MYASSSLYRPPVYFQSSPKAPRDKQTANQLLQNAVASGIGGAATGYVIGNAADQVFGGGWSGFGAYAVVVVTSTVVGALRGIDNAPHRPPKDPEHPPR